MSVIITNGQSWEDIARDYTLSPEYAPAIAIQNNYEGQSITGKKFWVEIPDSWMKPEFSGKEIHLPEASRIPWVAVGIATVLLLIVSK